MPDWVCGGTIFDTQQDPPPPGHRCLKLLTSWSGVREAVRCFDRLIHQTVWSTKPLDPCHNQAKMDALYILIPPIPWCSTFYFILNMLCFCCFFGLILLMKSYPHPSPRQKKRQKTVENGPQAKSRNAKSQQKKGNKKKKRETNVFMVGRKKQKSAESF